jgi:NAD/NADP transhydrogenase alpha subunit
LTPQEQRTIRHWSFAMAIIYGTVLLALIASAINGGPAIPAADTAAAEKRQVASDAISSERAPLTEASTQQ